MAAPWIDLTGRLALVTGAASGIGKAAAEAIAAAGASVVLLDRDEAKVSAAADAIGADGHRASGRVLDVADAAQWRALGAEVAAEHGRLDILVNAAGIARFDRIDAEMTPTYREVFAVNVEGTIHGMATALDVMRPAGRGAIVNIASTAGLKGNPGMASYGASKAAVIHLTRSAARELNLAGLDVRVNAVLPGFVESGMGDQVIDRFSDTMGGRDRMLSAFTSGRPGRPREIADLILFLVSDRASFMSGSAVVIDRAQSA
ncbi:SDR family NAD(P)-dependent oxidoreductase [uncultured Sphingomonas sp.]|uniref:SDR family NAD(P)-dependent oxidoreductase n=1 Tax=uncultured Sphingomonas sp. TaxID=158754 RepID=UPI0026311066|nr:SDR family NAD(P)-dependent oxidoreductase [uncultured Sphingomonas sp.]